MESAKKLNEKIEFGFVNIDKPYGPTSFNVSEFVKKQLKLKKTSHLGTLDPKVGGVLPVALGRACKLTSYFIGHEKKYVGILHTHKEQEIKKLQELINKKFIGKITQVPPHKSAVARVPRIREVFFWNLIEAGEDNKDFLFECKVEGGTYVRKLCSDLGELIGGAHMDELRRSSAGFFDESKLYPLGEFKEAIENYKSGNIKELEKMIIPAEDLIKKQFYVIQVKESSVKNLLTGKPLLEEYLIEANSLRKLKDKRVFAVFSGSKFVEIAKLVREGKILAKPEFVYN